MTSFMTAIQSPEFWVSIGFVLVVIVAFRPLKRYLATWGKKEAEHVQADIQNARKLKEEAADLLASYRKKTRRKNKERDEILASAGQEIDFLWREAEQKIKDQQAHKKQEAEHRLKMMQEQGHQEIKNKILTAVLQKTEQQILAQQKSGTLTEDMDETLKKFFETLDNEAEELQKRLSR